MRLAVLWNTSAPVLSIERRWVRSGSAMHIHKVMVCEQAVRQRSAAARRYQ